MNFELRNIISLQIFIRHKDSAEMKFQFVIFNEPVQSFSSDQGHTAI